MEYQIDTETLALRLEDMRERIFKGPTWAEHAYPDVAGQTAEDAKKMRRAEIKKWRKQAANLARLLQQELRDRELEAAK